MGIGATPLRLVALKPLRLVALKWTKKKPRRRGRLSGPESAQPASSSLPRLDFDGGRIGAVGGV